jgi:hypothetical protein
MQRDEQQHSHHKKTIIVGNQILKKEFVSQNFAHI